MIHQIVGASCLASARPNHDPRPALDEIAALGFNAIRGPFAGELPWAGQGLRHVYEQLPKVLGWCAERGLNAIVPYITEAGRGYNLEAHVTELEGIRASFRRVVLPEVGNECPHPSQGGHLTPLRCSHLAARIEGPVSWGADLDDESMAYAGGHFVSAHLDRGRDKWNQVRRVREMLAVSENTGKPVLSAEPIGADEASIPGKRESDPAFYFTLGALNRLFLGGSGVFHSQAGLMAERLGPNQRRCAEAYLRGARIWPGAHRLDYRNVGHGGSPITAARFNEGNMNHEGCTRSYSGLDGESGINVTLGISGDPGLSWGNGWRPGEMLGEMPGVRVVRVVR